MASNLRRLLSPATVAVVGASEKLGMSNNAVLPMLDAGIDVRLVNPNRAEVYGRATAPTLSALGEPIDAVLALVNAERAVDVVEEAAATGCGGVVVAAGGFTEMGETGAALQDRLVATAARTGIAVIGPNCSGFMNVPRRINLFTGGRMALEAGAVAVVSQSGFLVRSALAAGRERQLGFSIAVSSGNEAVCDLADYLDVLAEDDRTRVVCLVVEKIRAPEPFFAAVARVRAAGKAVIALKLGRTDRSRDIMRSHTGAIADESWVYDLVLGQIGVLAATDIDDLLDQAQLLAQVPPERWRPVHGAAVVASSGGVAAMAADAADDVGIALPALAELEEWVRANVPGDDSSRNPLDMTGFVMRDPDLLEALFERYGAAESIDALVLCWWAAEDDEAWSRTLLEPFAKAAARAGIPFVVSPVEATSLGRWTAAVRTDGLAFCRGLRSTYRALAALDGVARAGPVDPLPATVPVDASPPVDLVRTATGPIVPFGTAMQLLEQAGFTVAPHVVLPDGQDDDPAIDRLGDRLVVKLADVAHRTELEGVRVDVDRADLAAVVRELRAGAARHGVPATIAVQPMLRGHAEAFIGLQVRTDLGPVALLGRGGVLVEVAGGVRGRRLPLAPTDAAALTDEVAGPATAAGLRGQRPWPAEAVTAAVEAAGELWRQTGSWLGSADINPLIVTDDGVVAVDALLVADRHW